jgi:hypothetical protein
MTLPLYPLSVRRDIKMVSTVRGGCAMTTTLCCFRTDYSYTDSLSLIFPGLPVTTHTTGVRMYWGCYEVVWIFSVSVVAKIFTANYIVYKLSCQSVARSTSSDSATTYDSSVLRLAITSQQISYRSLVLPATIFRVPTTLSPSPFHGLSPVTPAPLMSSDSPCQWFHSLLPDTKPPLHPPAPHAIFTNIVSWVLDVLLSLLFCHALSLSPVLPPLLDILCLLQALLSVHLGSLLDVHLIDFAKALRRLNGMAVEFFLSREEVAVDCFFFKVHPPCSTCKGDKDALGRY